MRTKQTVTEKGKEAITKFKVLEFLGFYTYIRAYLETGRTHQIRVHMTDKGHPLIGDKTYGRSPQSKLNNYLIVQFLRLMHCQGKLCMPRVLALFILKKKKFNYFSLLSQIT
mgnify:CR=1 FL=1